ncbi:MAG TPA: hypothetical protein V6C88_03530 [Chroococcidiopsis sp.]
MSDDSRNDQFIPVNQILNLKPRLGPIPGEQVIPWIAIILGAYLVCQGILGQTWLATVLVSGWGIATWWALTGNASWQFLNKFRGSPHWTRGHLPYESLLSQERSRQRGMLIVQSRSPKSDRPRRLH